MAYIADKPYDDVRLAKAVGACIHAVLDNRFPEYGKTVSCITCIRHQYMQPIIGMSAQKKHEYQFDFKFIRRPGCEFVKPNSTEFTNMFLTFSPDGSLTCETHSDNGKMFAVELDKEVEKTVMWRYQGYSEPHISTGFEPIDFKKNIESLSGGKYGFVPTEIAKAIEDSETAVPEWPKENPANPAFKAFVNGAFDKIRSTLKKIVTDTIGENFDRVVEWRFELEKTPQRASAQYKLCKGAFENTLEVVVIFKDGGSNLEVVSVYTDDYRIREIASCLTHEIRKRFNLAFNEEEKEKKEMTTSEANYIYNVKMTSEMREACDKIAEDAKRQADRKAFYENYKLKVRLNAAYGTAALAAGAENKKLSVKEIVINEPAMVVFWEDGTKTVVTAKDEAFDAEKGLAMAFAKKALGNNWAAGGRFKAKLKHAKWAPKKQEKKEVLDPAPKAEKKKAAKTAKKKK